MWWSPVLPTFIDEVIHFPGPENITFVKGRIDQEIPKEVLDKLLRVPYFERAYAEDGYTPRRVQQPSFARQDGAAILEGDRRYGGICRQVLGGVVDFRLMPLGGDDFPWT